MREQGQVFDERLHRRIVAIACLQLDRKAFGKIAREYSGWVEALQLRQSALDSSHVAAHQLGHGRQLDRQVAGLIDLVDEVGANDAIRRVPHFLGELRQQILAEGRRPCEGLIETRQVVAFGPRTVRLPRARVARIVEIALPLRPRDFMPRIDRLLVVGFAFRGWLGLDRRRFGAILGGGIVELKEGILLKLSVDIGGQLDIRRLQQLDRLLQLRRHHESLALPEVESLRERHGRIYKPKWNATANFVPTPLFSVKGVLSHSENRRFFSTFQGCLKYEIPSIMVRKTPQKTARPHCPLGMAMENWGAT